MRTRNDSPCDRDCPERSSDPNCHSYCERYTTFAEQRKKDRDKNLQQNTWTIGKMETAIRVSKYNKKKERGII